MNALIQQRVEEELARRTKEEQRRQEEERRKLLAEAGKDLVISRARAVVEERQESRTDRESPAIWAAVRALSSFVSDVSSRDQVRQSSIMVRGSYYEFFILY